MRRFLQFRTRAAALAVAAVAIVVIAGTASAGPAGAVKTFTGCLVVGDGVIVKIKEGDSPKSSCSNGQTPARLSGGDITKISVTGGLTLTNGGESGDVEINLDAKYSLPQGCADGRIAEWDTEPEPDRWICGVDDDTTYAAGTGLHLDTSATPDEFEIESAYRLPGKACSAPNFSRGFDSTGTIVCDAPPSAGAVQVFASRQSPESGIGIPSDAALHDVVTLVIPAGTYSITAIGNGSQGDQREWGILCSLLADTSQLSEAHAAVGQDQPGNGIQSAYSMAMASLRTFSSQTTLKVACATGADGVGAEHFVIQAIKYG